MAIPVLGVLCVIKHGSSASPAIVQWFSQPQTRHFPFAAGHEWKLPATHWGRHRVDSPVDPQRCHRNPLVSGWKVGWFPHERWIDRWIGCFMIPMALVYLVPLYDQNRSKLGIPCWSPIGLPWYPQLNGNRFAGGFLGTKGEGLRTDGSRTRAKTWPFSSLIYPLNNGGTTIVMVVYR